MKNESRWLLERGSQAVIIEVFSGRSCPVAYGTFSRFRSTFLRAAGRARSQFYNEISGSACPRNFGTSNTDGHANKEATCSKAGKHNTESAVEDVNEAETPYTQFPEVRDAQRAYTAASRSSHRCKPKIKNITAC